VTLREGEFCIYIPQQANRCSDTVGEWYATNYTQATGVSCWSRSESGVNDGGGVAGFSAVWQVIVECDTSCMVATHPTLSWYTLVHQSPNTELRTL